MTSQDRLISIGVGRFSGTQPANSAALSSLDDEAVTDRWPVWLRLVVIVGLSASLWACIIFGILVLID